MFSFSYLTCLSVTAQLDESDDISVCYVIDWFTSSVVVRFSCTAAFADSPLTPDDVTSSTVLFSLSRARRLGSAVLEARAAQTSPVAAILEQEGGKHLFSAKVCRTLSLVIVCL